MIKKTRRFAVALLSAMLVASLGTLVAVGGSAFAATSGDATSTFTASVSGSGDLVSVALPTTTTLLLSKTPGASTSLSTLNGAGTSTTASADNLITLDDATGTTAGWTATIQSTALTEVAPSGGFASGTSAIVLPTGTLNVGEPTSVMADSGQSSSDTPPTISTLSGGLAAIDGGSAVTIASAAAGGGAGTWGLQWGTADPVLEFIVSNNADVVDTVNYPSAPTPYSATVTVTMTENAQTA